jgi:hypothetical protein
VEVGADHTWDDHMVAGVDPLVNPAVVGFTHVLDPVALGDYDSVPEEPVLYAIEGDNPFTLDPYGHDRD